jgi:hypothetical protein
MGRRRAALGWGLVGALAFLVLALGYQLLGGEPVDPVVLGGVTVVVFAATTAATALLRGRLE